MTTAVVQIATSKQMCAQSKPTCDSGTALSWFGAPSALPNRFLSSRSAAWYSCLILLQTAVKEEDLKRSPTRGFHTTFCSGVAFRLRLLPVVLTWATLQLGHVSHWPSPWLPGLTLNLSLQYELAWRTLDPWLTTVTKPNSWLWLNLRPASLLQMCLVTQTPGWSWLPSLDLLCLPCLGTVGLDTVPPHFVYSWLLAHLPLWSNTLARALPDKHNFWSPWSSDHTVNKTGRKACGVGEGYPRTLATSTKNSREL